MHSRTLLLAVFLFSTFSFAQLPFKPLSEKISSKIDSLIQLKSPRPFNGVISITKNFKPVYTQVYGWDNFDKKTPLQYGNFLLMSNSKQVTAVLVLKQYEKGKIDLNTPIKAYLPELTQSWADSVTVHQLLTHTHGIKSLDEPLKFKPGTDFMYGNLSNVLLGRILENVTGESYKVLAEKLFKKMGMRGTFCFSKEENQHLVKGHLFNGNEFKVLWNVMLPEEEIPAAGIVSNVHDMAHWNYKLHKGNMLKKKTYKLMITPSAMSQHDVFGQEKMGYGYNIRIAEQDGIKYYGHTGLGGGFTSLNLFFPDQNISLTILENIQGEGEENWYFYEKEIKKLVIENISKI